MAVLTATSWLIEAVWPFAIKMPVRLKGEETMAMTMRVIRTLAKALSGRCSSFSIMATDFGCICQNVYEAGGPCWILNPMNSAA